MARTHPYLDGPYPRAFAHRGWHVDDLAGMENSLSAFRRASAEGFQYIETDVHATSDGVVVVHHDALLDRTTDRTGAIAAQRWADVGKAKIAGREQVSRLEDVLEELPDTFFNIDVKADGAVDPVLRVVHRVGAWHRVCLASFADKRLTRLRLRGGKRLLTALGSRSAGALWAAARLPVLPLRSAVRGQLAQLPVRRGRVTVIENRLLRIAHRLGLEVHAWTVDAAAEMAALLDMGVDGLVTDRPDTLRDVLRRRKVWAMP
ncbi:glycerophosphodiester phosphodiesterase family protein [Allokutzneria albata]|uniref:Glycerophosphoryl diester phosphodiesterase n=1 Tax=Allokutzneria albata TaxID=211114 RepID=A0A1G9TAA5_ALLAB|nr:glycerophosphodiester phosphodiesterase family protein [Allokutzneria albata]SDM44581.1 glycerophosphoryl diester phosphodiesterase [Allokutzneria albata]